MTASISIIWENISLLKKEFNWLFQMISLTHEKISLFQKTSSSIYIILVSNIPISAISNTYFTHKKGDFNFHFITYFSFNYLRTCLTVLKFWVQLFQKQIIALISFVQKSEPFQENSFHQLKYWNFQFHIFFVTLRTCISLSEHAFNNHKLHINFTNQSSKISQTTNLSNMWISVSNLTVSVPYHAKFWQINFQWWPRRGRGRRGAKDRGGQAHQREEMWATTPG